MTKYYRCRKKPVEVLVRKVDIDEGEVETIEGFKNVDPNTHFIIKGVDEEEYPIRKDIFFKTYSLLEEGLKKPTCSVCGSKASYNDFGEWFCENCWNSK